MAAGILWGDPCEAQSLGRLVPPSCDSCRGCKRLPPPVAGAAAAIPVQLGNPQRLENGSEQGALWLHSTATQTRGPSKCQWRPAAAAYRARAQAGHATKICTCALFSWPQADVWLEKWG